MSQSSQSFHRPPTPTTRLKALAHALLCSIGEHHYYSVTSDCAPTRTFFWECRYCHHHVPAR